MRARLRDPRASSGIGLAQPLGDRRQAVVVAQRQRLLQLVEPLRIAPWAQWWGFDSGMPKPSRLTRRRTRSVAHAGVEHRHVAAHAVPEQIDRLAGQQRVEHVSRSPM
jgi:hypothetical protein